MISLIRAEAVKLRTIRTFYGMMLVALILIVLGTVLPLAFSEVAGSPGASLQSEDLQRATLSTGSTIATIMVLLGIIAIASEYRHGTIGPTYLITPRRERVLAAKVVTAVGAGFVLAVLAAALGLAIVLPWLDAKNVELALSNSELAAEVTGGIIYASLAGAFGIGFGGLIRNQTGALVAALVLIVIIQPLLSGFLPEVGRFLPDAAGAALSGSGELAGEVRDEGLSAVAGGLLYLGYAVVLVAAAGVRTSRSDVTEA
jgi:ABC-2 type transport system permease protein